MSDINRDLLNSFIDESLDALGSVDALFVNLEAAPFNKEIISAIFRPIHSLKGNAAYFGLMSLKKCAHTMETLLDQVRQGTRAANRKCIDALLPGVDLLRTMLGNVREDRCELADGSVLEQVLGELQKIISIQPGTSNSRITEIITHLHGSCSAQMRPLLNELTQLLSPLTADVNLQSLPLPQPKPPPAQGVAADLYTLLFSSDSIPKGSDPQQQAGVYIETLTGSENDFPLPIALELKDIFTTFTSTDTGLDALALSLLREKLSEAVSFSSPLQSNPENRPVAAPEQSTESGGVKVHHDKTMRIPEQSLDDFLRWVGELLGVEEMLRFIIRQIQTGATAESIFGGLKETLNQFGIISKELRTQIMDVRKVEASTLLQKTHRLVRDIATQEAKMINVVIMGDKIRIDKSYIDLLDAPLTHMVRNAADHGIELPAARVNSGKPESGTITVAVSESAETLQLTISDDGAGLNHDGLRAKAVELGFIAEGAVLTTTNVIDLLFMSGVSTARNVTEISGRGVGMDVVKQAIIGAGGKIEIDSEPGKGSTFTVAVPRNASTQILDGYVVSSFCSENYVLPLSNVIEAFTIHPGDISPVGGKGEMVIRRSTAYPVQTIDRLIGANVDQCCAAAVHEEVMGILVELKGIRTVIAVKKIVGIQKVVCKPVDSTMLGNDFFDGAAISGTGMVSMIVNMEKLLQSP